MAKKVNEKNLKYLEYINRETGNRHHRYDEEMLQYHLMKNGDMRAIDASVEMFSSPLLGHVSEDLLRTARYMFVASITIVTRFAIEGGMDEERAYNASDLFIQEMDLLDDIEDIKALHKEMFIFFTTNMANLEKGTVYSMPVIKCMDYIYYHLYEKISVDTLAELVDLHPNYLSNVFRKEVGTTIMNFVKKQRLTAARNMLQYSDFSYAEIASILAFSSQSHFTKVFREEVGMTPKEYRMTHYKEGFNHNKKEVQESSSTS